MHDAIDGVVGAKPVLASSPPDGGYGWVVVAASFVVHLLVLGNIYSFGVLFPVYISVFHQSQGSVAWVGSISAGLMTGLGAYSGAWADQYGNGLMVCVGSIFVSVGFLLASYSTELWQLYLTQGFLAGIGYSLAFISGISVVGQWFTEKRGLAIGIAVAGSGLGQFALSIVTGILLEKYKWRTTLRYLALIDFVGLTLCGIAIRRFVPRYKSTPSNSGMIYFKDRNFVLLYVSSVICTLGLFMPYTHLPKYAELHGVSVSDSIYILSVMGIASAAGRIAIGFGADALGKLPMLVMCMVVGGASTLCWMACTTFVTLMIYGVVYGFFAGGVISLLPTVLAELYGIKKIGTVIGILYTATAAGNLLAAPFAGFLYDATHNYYTSISLAGGLLLLSSTFVCCIDKSKKFEYDEVEEGASGDKPSSAKVFCAIEEGKYIDAGKIEEIGRVVAFESTIKEKNCAVV